MALATLKYPLEKSPLKSAIPILCLLAVLACGQISGDAERCLENGSCVAELKVLKVSGEIPLSPQATLWNSPEGPKNISLDLGPQMITNPKWPDPSIKKVWLSAVRNRSEIAFLLEWEDSTDDHTYGHSDRFTDQAAVMFPLQPEAEAPLITMGSENQVVNLWQWKAAWEKDLAGDKKNRSSRRENASSPSGTSAMAPRRESPVEDLNAEGFSTLTIQDEQNVQGKGVWKDHRWRVVFRRSLTDSDTGDAQFKGATQMAIAVWNGANKERNGQKGIIGWILLRF